MRQEAEKTTIRQEDFSSDNDKDSVGQALGGPTGIVLGKALSFVCAEEMTLFVGQERGNREARRAMIAIEKKKCAWKVSNEK